MITIEELLPFPSEQLKLSISLMNPNANIIWVQEEPENAGAYIFASLYLKKLGRELHYIGRPAIASVAAGYNNLHYKEGNEYMIKAL